MCAKVGRPSIPPEQLLRAQLLQLFYSVRSERLLMEEMDYNVLFCWFVGLNLDDAVWDATVFTKNRNWLLEAEVAKEFLARGGGAGARKRMDFGRALHRGRHASGSVGQRVGSHGHSRARCGDGQCCKRSGNRARDRGRQRIAA
jgi:hypothetical protein